MAQMKQSDRHLIYEAAALILAGLGLAFSVPALMSAHDSVALFAAGFLVLAWLGWLGFFLYRAGQKG